MNTNDKKSILNIVEDAVEADDLEVLRLIAILIGAKADVLALTRAGLQHLSKERQGMVDHCISQLLPAGSPE